jgi:hypothetical protein
VDTEWNIHTDQCEWQDLYSKLVMLAPMREMVIERPFATSVTDLTVFKAMGVCEAFARFAHAAVIEQEPFVRKGVFSKYRVPGHDHARDAAAHLIYRLQSRKENEACELLELLRERRSDGAS